MCPPKHFPNTRVSAPSLPPSSSLVCQITFPTQPQYPRQQSLLWACTISKGMVSVVHVVPVWLGGKTWGGALYKLWEHYEGDTGAHKLCGPFAYSCCKTLCKYWVICILVLS